MWLRTFDTIKLFLFIILLVSATHGFAQVKTVRFVDGEGDILNEVEYILHDEHIYLPVDTLKTVFDSEMKHSYHTPSKQLTVKTKDKEIKLWMGNPSINIDDGKQIIILNVPPRIISGQQNIPISFFEKVLPELDDVSVIYKPELQRVRIMQNNSFLSDIPENNPLWTVIIDPGHGGEKDVGCKSQTGIYEKDVVLAVAKEIETQSKQHGFSIHLTRNQDVNKSRQQRYQIANRFQGKLYISLHCNSSFSQNHKGIRLYLNNPYGQLQFRTAPFPKFGNKDLNISIQANYLQQSKTFATILQKELNFFAKDPIVISEFPIIALNDVFMPAVLIELGYLSNLDDTARLSNRDDISELAQTIVRAIQLYSTKVRQSTKPNDATSTESSNPIER